MKYIITESQYNNAINRFITYQLEPHEEMTSKEHPDSILQNPNSIFWVKNGEVIVEILKPKYFWVDYHIWETISRMFSLDYDETRVVISEWLEEHYELGSLRPISHIL